MRMMAKIDTYEIRQMLKASVLFFEDGEKIKVFKFDIKTFLFSPHQFNVLCYDYMRLIFRETCSSVYGV